MKLALFVLFIDRWGWKGAVAYIGFFVIGSLLEVKGQQWGGRIEAWIRRKRDES